jgi:hypothetical protein
MADKMLSVKEAAKLLHMHPLTLKAWDAKGKIKVLHTPQGRRIPESEIRRVLQSEPYLDPHTRGVPVGTYKRIIVNFTIPEHEQIEIVKNYLFKNGVLNSTEDHEFGRYCVRHVLIEFINILQGGLHKDVDS